MAEPDQRRRIGVVMDGPAGQRFAERLIRAGVLAQAVAPDVFERQAEAGRFYLASVSLSASACAVIERGAHVCLTPPWPVGVAMLGGSAVGAAQVEQRGAVRYTTAFDVAATRVLKILYRERLVGALGALLAESEMGEPLLATLPRASNRHGYLIVTTLQLGAASAQTRFDDVARLIDSLAAWCTRHAEPVSQVAPAGQGDVDERSQAEAPAQVIALALALAMSDPAHPRQATISIERARNDFQQVCHLLGVVAEDVTFESGWGWLAAHGVVSAAEREEGMVNLDMLERYSVMWQLGPRLRRLGRLAEMNW